MGEPPAGRRPAGRPRHDFTPDRDPGLHRRRTEYAVVMGTCVLLILLAWNVVRLWSVPAAVAMSVVAALLAPTAVILANRSKGD